MMVIKFAYAGEFTSRRREYARRRVDRIPLPAPIYTKGQVVQSLIKLTQGYENFDSVL